MREDTSIVTKRYEMSEGSKLSLGLGEPGRLLGLVFRPRLPEFAALPLQDVYPRRPQYARADENLGRPQDEHRAVEKCGAWRRTH